MIAFNSRMLFLVLFSFQLFSQEKVCNCFLHGEVTDLQTKQPIVGAIIQIKETGKGVTTDDKGHYHLENLCHGQYTLVCKIIGYDPLDIKINLEHKNNHEHNFSLHEADLHLDHIEIKAQKIIDPTQSKVVLSGNELAQLRGTTLAEALTQITGVNSLQTGSSIAKPVIHGMHSNRVLIMNNGLRQEGQQWGSEHAPEIDPFVAKKLTVVRGAAGVRYGSDAIAGVVLIEPDALPDSAKITGEVNTVLFSNGRQGVISGILQGGIQKISGLNWRTQGTFKRGGNVQTARYNLANTGMGEYNFSGAVGYRAKGSIVEGFYSQFNTKIGVFAGSHIGNTTDLVEAIQRSQPLDIYTPANFTFSIDRPYQVVQHSLAKVKASQEIGSGNKLYLTLGRQYNFRREVDVLRGDRNLAQTFRLTTYSVELLFEHRPIIKSLTGNIGTTLQLQRNLSSGNTWQAPRLSTVLIPNFNNANTGIFIIERLAKKRFDLEAGLRYDLRQLTTFYIPRGQRDVLQKQLFNANTSGTIGLNYRLNTRFNLQLNAASAWRAATVNELFSNGVHHGSASFEQGDEALVPETALNTSATLQHNSKYLQTEWHGYINQIKDFIFLSPTGRAVLTIRGAFPAFMYTQTDAVFTGFDFTNRLFWRSVEFKTKYSYLQARDNRNDQWLIMIPANRIENSISQSFNKVKISLTHLFVAKQTRVPTKLLFDVPAEEMTFTNNGGDFLPPPPAYTLWSSAISYEPSEKIMLSFSGTNLLNVAYRDYLNRFRYFADDMGRNLILRFGYKF